MRCRRVVALVRFSESYPDHEILSLVSAMEMDFPRSSQRGFNIHMTVQLQRPIHLVRYEKDDERLFAETIKTLMPSTGVRVSSTSCKPEVTDISHALVISGTESKFPAYIMTSVCCAVCLAAQPPRCHFGHGLLLLF